MELLRKIINESEEEILKYLKSHHYKSYTIEIEKSEPPNQERLFKVFIPRLKKSKQSPVLKDLSTILNKTCKKHSKGNLTTFFESRSRIGIVLRVGVSK